MANFHHQFCEAIDSSRPFWQRQSRFRSCLSIYCKAACLSYYQALRRYEAFYWIGEPELGEKIGRIYLHHRTDKNRDHHLSWALATLLTERNQFLRKLTSIQQQQLRRKLLRHSSVPESTPTMEKVDWIPHPVRWFPEAPIRAQPKNKAGESNRGRSAPLQ